MNKSIAVFLGAVSISANMFASEVVWNTLTIYDMGPSYSAYLSNNQAANIEFLAKSVGGGVEIAAVKWNYAEICNAWMLAEVGTCVDETFVEDSLRYFHMNNIYGNGECRVDYEILIPDNESVYLAFAYAKSETPLAVNFGWAEISVDVEGKPYVVRSATDLGGNAIFVGAIPEPSSAFLLMIGLGMIALCRRDGVNAVTGSLVKEMLDTCEAATNQCCSRRCRPAR